MKRSALCVCLLLAGVAIWFALSWAMHDPGVEPGRAPDERDILQMPVATTYPSAEQLTRAMFNLKSPAAGLTSFGDKAQPDGSILTGFSVEIPGLKKARLLVFRGRDGAYSLIDDFVAPGEPQVMQVVERDGSLIYSTLEGQQVFVRPIVARR